MRITHLGHAGLYLETSAGSILCDPWFTPAYFASWFPFPRNDGLDVTTFCEPDFLYVSHLHRDHFDPDFLAEHVSKEATVLLPDFPVDDLAEALRALGFQRFVEVSDRSALPLGGGVKVWCFVEASPSDGPLGDSALVVQDGECLVLDQNDARPRRMERISALGRFDAHFVQFSGANWFPVVYDFPPEQMAVEIEQKRQRGMERARDFITRIGAAHVFPCAGPPCFLDDSLMGFNELDEHTPYPDQSVFLEELRRWGVDGGELVVPGTVVELDAETCRVTQPQGDEEAWRPFTAKRAYLEEYRRDKAALLDAERASWRREGVDVVASLQEFFEPVLASGDELCRRVGTKVLLASSKAAAVVDFEARRVVPFEGQYCPYRFRIDDDVFDCVVADRYGDWVNSLFLSMRFTAERDQPYLEDLYTFFKSLSPDRVGYVEKLLSATSAMTEEASTGEGEASAWCRLNGWLVQRQCPHRQADLREFGSVDGSVLTCAMHGWRFDLETGECLTARGRWPIQARRLEDPPGS